MWISPMAEWSKLLSLAGILPREIMKGLLCQQRTKCYQCNLMKSKKEGMARAALILGYICLVFLGSWVERWQKSQKDIPQFHRPTLNAQSLNFS